MKLWVNFGGDEGEEANATDLWMKSHRAVYFDTSPGGGGGRERKLDRSVGLEKKSEVESDSHGAEGRGEGHSTSIRRSSGRPVVGVA